MCLTFQGSAGFVGTTLRMTPQPGDRDGMQCTIQRTVSTLVEAMPTSLPKARGCGAPLPEIAENGRWRHSAPSENMHDAGTDKSVAQCRR